jgi:RimJ/RimL family protein N-acetyltransferase
VNEGLRVRRATPGDADAVSRLARQVSAEPEGWLLTLGTWRSSSEERRAIRLLRRHPDAALFIAETDEGIVGRLSLTRDPHPSSQHVADIGLMVAHGHRRRGVGKALLEAAVEWARSSGVSKLELHVFPHNEAAIKLYESFGFEREGYRRRQYRRGQEYVDAILMAYEVTDA